MKVKDDDIIRISYNINSYMDFASMFMAPMLIAAAIGIIAGLIAVSSVARQIMKRITAYQGYERYEIMSVTEKISRT